MLTLSQRERDRLAVLHQVKECLVAASRGAELIGVSTRHFRRLRRAWEKEGDAVVATDCGVGRPTERSRRRCVHGR